MRRQSCIPAMKGTSTMSSIELSKLNHHTNLAQWQQLADSFRYSDMTGKAWCAENGVSEKSFYYRQRKARGAAQLDKGLNNQLPR